MAAAFPGQLSRVRARLQKGKVDKAAAALAAAQAQGDSHRTKELQAQLDGEQLKLSAAEASKAEADALVAAGQGVSEATVRARFHDALAAQLDAERGSSVTDKDIYRCVRLPLAAAAFVRRPQPSLSRGALPLC